MTDPAHELADLIADHLNGHLNEQQAARVNAALRDDPVFRRLVEHEARVRAHIRETATPIEHPPNQLAFERALQARSAWRRPMTLAGGLAAACALVAVGVVVLSPSSNEAVYETLTDPSTTAHIGTVRLAVDGTTELAPLIAQYNLELIAEFPDLRAAMVRLPDTAEPQRVLDALRNEPGVRFVESENAETDPGETGVGTATN
ncbi:MAG: hypothetical protein AAGL69_02165 [Pseudomonadota bacterium]